MKRLTPSTLLTVLVLLILFIGGGSMLWGEFSASEATASETAIDWRALYPFDHAVSDSVPAAAEAETTYLSAVTEFQGRLEDSTEYMLGRQQLLELCGAFRRLTFQTKTDEIVLLNNGYLTTIVPPTDNAAAASIADSVIRFAHTSEESGTPFLYIQVPQKVCRYDDEMPLGEITYINSNLDYHLSLLQGSGISTLDLRESLHNDSLEHYSMFFRTDHHWQMSSGLWAARTICEELNDRYGFGLETDLLLPERYSEKTLENRYLGTQGRTVTRGYISPDDFTILFPNFETDFHVEHPDKALVLDGDFSETMFDWQMLNNPNYYESSAYEAILCGNRPLTRIRNNRLSDGLRVMIVHDSYFTVVAPFLANVCGEIDLLDVRAANGNFNGSLDAYREEMQPDLVIVVLCSPECIDRSEQ